MDALPDRAFPVVAYLHPQLSGVLLCREHGARWEGLIPLTARDLAGVGFCSWATDDDATVCGRALPGASR
ncbi:hypothetical protein [Streptomyces sp. SPB074]|uniref:hypothetical protein n=1 Tax=Streptomyces sp. (strain SPB074) TaxID=465543 RepID=UPI00017F0E3A|nr:hypothetical protein [Streptomyces sp. SPB074]